jgi:hypothetical protein
MYEIRRRSNARTISLAVVFCMVSSLIPIGIVSAQTEPATSVLVFPILDESESGYEDLGPRASSAMEIALNAQPGYAANKFTRHSALVQRAVAEGRIRQVDVEAADTASRDMALFLGHELGFATILIASVQSFEIDRETQQANVILSGQLYSVKDNVDEATGIAVDEPTVLRAFGVKGSSTPRADYTGADNPLISEALRDAARKAALSLAGLPQDQVAAEKKDGKNLRWAIYALAVAALIVGVNNAGSSPPKAGPADQVKPVTNVLLQTLQTNLRVSWNEPTGTALQVLRYEVSRNVDGGSFSVISSNLSPGSTQYTDIDTLSGRHVYQYRVRVLYANGQASGYTYSGAIAFTRS